MKEVSTVSAALAIHHLSDLNTYIINEKGETSFIKEKNAIPAWLETIRQEDMTYIFQHISKQKTGLFVFTNSLELSFLAYSFHNGKGELSILIVGPYLEVFPNLYSLSVVHQFNNQQRQELRDFTSQLQLLNTDKISSLYTVLPMFNHFIEKNKTPERIRTKSDDESGIPKKSEIIYEDPELIKIRYQIEAELIEAVEVGDKDKVTRLMDDNQMLFTFSDRFPNQPLRRMKNLGIVFNTLLRSAAARGGVSPLLLHRVSEKYAFQLEYANQLSEIQRKQKEMIEEYCDLVISSSLSGYSKITQTVMEYMLAFYDRPVDYSQLSELCFAHPSHISRKFKQDTEQTISSYQQQIRIRKARHLLKNEKLPIVEIAWSIGYEDASYFSRVFKKEIGLTPSQYRDQSDMKRNGKAKG